MSKQKQLDDWYRDHSHEYPLGIPLVIYLTDAGVKCIAGVEPRNVYELSAECDEQLDEDGATLVHTVARNGEEQYTLCDHLNTRQQELINKYQLPPLWRLLLEPQQLDTRLDQLATQLSTLKQPVAVLGILPDSYMFVSELGKRLSFPHTTDLVYQASNSLDHFPGTVLVLGALLDSTMLMVKLQLRDLSVHHVVTCTAFARSGLVPDYCGFPGLPALLVGYGLGQNSTYRNVPALFTYQDMDREELATLRAKLQDSLH